MATRGFHDITEIVVDVLNEAVFRIIFCAIGERGAMIVW
jgi:hypothetical protein